MSVSDSEDLERMWTEKPDLIRLFVDARPKYDQLVGEISYILKNKILEAKIEIASITGRAKTLKSFAEKIARKEYGDPLNDITDFAGVRCVFLYLADRIVIERIIEREFVIIERIDKVEEKAVDEFGYGALHYIVKLGKRSSGARYDDLKEFACEIQVRSVLQDAWAIIDHHLIYKKETDAPKEFRRKLNSLSGLFETADSQFDQLRIEREKYLEVLGEAKSGKNSSNQELNVDLLSSILKHHYPGRTNVPGMISSQLNKLTSFGYKTAGDVEALLSKTKKIRDVIRKEVPAKQLANEIGRALAIEHDAHRARYTPRIRAIIDRELMT